MSKLKLIPIYLFIFFLSFIITTLIHELGHGLIALIGGGRFEIILGATKKEKGILILNTKYFKIYSSLYLGGYCNYYFMGKLKNKSKLYLFFLYLGGILLQVLFGLFIFQTKYKLPINLYFKIYKPLQLVNILSIFLSLLPIDPKEKGYESDGSKIKKLIIQDK